MTETQKAGLRKVLLFLLAVLFAELAYTFLHEGGHALAILISGGTVTEFNLNFFDLSAHVGHAGDFTRAQTLTVNLAGVSLPILAWAVFMLFAPRRGSQPLEIIKIVCSVAFLSTLLAWIVIPILFLAGARPGDDSTAFLINSGLHPLLVTGGALLVLTGGLALFRFKVGRFQDEISFLRGNDPAQNPALGKAALALAAVIILAGAAGLAFGWFGGAGAITGAPRPPEGYSFVQKIDLPKAEYERETVFAFVIDKKEEAGVYLLLQDVVSEYLEVRLEGLDGYSRIITHSEGYTANYDTHKMEAVLEPGEYRLTLSSRSSRGALSVFMR
jgi:hypothetical protein